VLRKEFVDEVRVTLEENGWHQDDIEEVAKEVNEELQLAEVQGFSIEETVGMEPREYATQLIYDTKKERKKLLFLGGILLVYTFWYFIGDRTLRYGFMQFSSFEMLMAVLVAVVYSLGAVLFMKQTRWSRKKTKTILFLFVGLLVITLFSSSYVWNASVTSTIISLSIGTSWIVTIATFLVLVVLIFQTIGSEGNQLNGVLLVLLCTLPTISSMPQLSSVFRGSTIREVIGFFVTISFWIVVLLFISRNLFKAKK